MVVAIAALYEAGVPPPPLPLLTIQTDLTCVSPTAATITATEDLILLPRATSKILGSTPAGPNRTQKSSHRSPSPYVVPVPRKVTFDDGKSDSSELSELDEVEGDDGDTSSVALIAKPPGQAGRIRGGYNLESALNWPAKTFSELQVCPDQCNKAPRPNEYQNYVHRLIDTHLDITQSYQPQRENARQLVRKEVSSCVFRVNPGDLTTAGYKCFPGAARVRRLLAC